MESTLHQQPKGWLCCALTGHNKSNAYGGRTEVSLTILGKRWYTDPPPSSDLKKEQHAVVSAVLSFEWWEWSPALCSRVILSNCRGSWPKNCVCTPVFQVKHKANGICENNDFSHHNNKGKLISVCENGFFLEATQLSLKQTQFNPFVHLLFCAVWFSNFQMK